MARIGWHALPSALRADVELALGGTVVAASSQAAGFSPGSADRVQLDDGRRAFVKAVDATRNEHSAALHRDEARIVASLPAAVRAPRLRAAVEHGTWIALALDDVDGRHPVTAASDTVAVLDALADVAAVEAPAGLPVAADLFAEQEEGAWDRILASGTVADADAHARANAERMRRAATDLVAVVGGTSLLHLDCRSDNVLLDAAGDAWLVDWPWAATGSPWLDGLAYLLDARMHGAADAEAHLASHPLFRDADRSAVDAVLAGLAGSFHERASQPEPPGVTGIRAFQRREGAAASAWLAERWS